MSLQDAFEAFASFGGAATKEMDNAHFTKMLKESKIIDGKTFTGTDADLLFSKIKGKGERKITFSQFQNGLADIATKKKSSSEAIADIITNSSPQSSGTKADAVKFHDDKNLYTGVYKAGGPTNIDRDPASLSGIVDRRVSNDIRGATTTQK